VIDDVGAVLEGPLEVRRSEGVVYDEQCILPFRDLADGGRSVIRIIGLVAFPS